MIQKCLNGFFQKSSRNFVKNSFRENIFGRSSRNCFRNQSKDFSWNFSIFLKKKKIFHFFQKFLQKNPLGIHLDLFRVFFSNFSRYSLKNVSMGFFRSSVKNFSFFLIITIILFLRIMFQKFLHSFLQKKSPDIFTKIIKENFQVPPIFYYFLRFCQNFLQ